MVIKKEKARNLLLFLIGIFCQTSPMMSRGIMFFYLGFCFMLFLMAINIKKTKLGRGFTWYVIFVIFCLFTLLYTINNLNPDYVYIRILTYLLLVFFASPFLDEKENLKRIVKGFIIGGLIGIFIVLIKQYNLIGKMRLGNHIYGSFAEFGNVCMLTLASFIWIKDEMFKNKIIKLLVFMICCVAIILSGARKAILVPALMYLFLKIFDRKSRLGKKALILAIISVFILVFIYMSLNNETLYKMVGYRIESGISSVLGEEENDASLSDRKKLKELAFQMFNEKPITGYGMHGFAYRNYYTYGYAVYCHHGYLEILSCYGLIGFILFYWPFIYFASNFKKYLYDDVGLFLISYMLIILIMEPYSISYLMSSYIILIVASLQYKKIE